MLNTNLFKSAHKMARDIKGKYVDVDYKFQFGLCLSYLNKIEGEIKMVKLEGSEKQIAWAEKIRKESHEYLTKLNTVETNRIEVATVYGTNLNVLESEIKDIYKDTEKFENAKANLALAIKALENEDSAKFIIENRENLVSAIDSKNNIKTTFDRLRKAFTDDVAAINK